eukprot:366347-Chlamydomonas_euryale.AAC.8
MPVCMQVRVPVDARGRPKGFALVVMEDASAKVTRSSLSLGLSRGGGGITSADRMGQKGQPSCASSAGCMVWKEGSRVMRAAWCGKGQPSCASRAGCMVWKGAAQLCLKCRLHVSKGRRPPGHRGVVPRCGAEVWRRGVAHWGHGCSCLLSEGDTSLETLLVAQDAGQKHACMLQ